MSLLLRVGVLLGLLIVPRLVFAQAQGTITQTSVSCATISTTLLAANAATTFIKVKVPNGGATVWFNWTGVAAVATLPSEDFAGGTSIVFYRSTGFLPRTALTCISAGGSAQSVLLEYQ